MARRPRTALGGLAYDVMNRVSGRQDLFEDAGDYEAFERVLTEARERERMRSNLVFAGLPREETGQASRAAG
jgi:putative transposase